MAPLSASATGAESFLPLQALEVLVPVEPLLAPADLFLLAIDLLMRLWKTQSIRRRMAL